jgi:hypothetical protein
MNIFIYYVVIVTILVEATTELIVKADIFYGLRRFLADRARFLEEVLSCGYCFSVWASLFWNTVLFNIFSVSDRILESDSYFKIELPKIFILIIFIICVILTHRLSNFLHGLSDRLFSTKKDIRYQKED